jgi:uncharacterized protein
MRIDAIEPQPPDPSWPRYSHRPFPFYRFVPGRSPHPRRHLRGHSYGQEEAKPVLLSPEQWRGDDEYLYGIDLYNYAYWWECHETLERLWHAAGRTTEQGNFFRALIQLAAANLKHFLGDGHATSNLLEAGLARLETIPACYMGIDVANLTDHLRQHKQGPAPLIRMNQ